MVKIKNEYLSVEIAEMGAEIKSVVADDVEQMWDGRAEVWGNTAPICFPICGGLKDDRFIFEGKEYTLNKHGYGKFTLFTVESKSDVSVTFLHTSDENTRVGFPFDYELRITYSLEGRKLVTEYEVKNLSGKTMYFNIGSHEAYYTPEGIEDYDVIFEKDETVDDYVLYGNLLSYQTKPMLKDARVFPLYDKYFIIDALVFKDLVSRSATLRNRKTGRQIKVDFPDSSYFLLWHKHGAPYICLEPWNGIPDRVGSSYELVEKEGITALEAGKTYTNVHTITFG